MLLPDSGQKVVGGPFCRGGVNSCSSGITSEATKTLGSGGRVLVFSLVAPVSRLVAIRHEVAITAIRGGMTGKTLPGAMMFQAKAKLLNFAVIGSAA